jgi:O-antigen/teichoic acid export membrane protein
MLGFIIPMAISFVTAPILIHQLGEAAYGLQSLAGVVIGYFAVMDFGLDLPITKYLAEDRASGDTDAQNRLLSTTLYLYIVIGLIGAVALLLSAEWLSTVFFKVPPELEEQAIAVFRLSGIGLLGSVGLSWGRAVGMGVQRFEVTYGVSTVVNLAGATCGLVAVFLGQGIVGYVFWRVLWSFLGIFAYYVLALRIIPTFRLQWRFDRSVVRRVRSYVGYGALNRIMGSFGGRLDQTLIGVWLGVAAAGIYALPFLLVSSLGYMLAYMVGFIFPMSSELHSQGDLDRLRSIATRTSTFLAAIACMTFIPLMLFGEPFMHLWVGPAVAEQAATVFLLLALSTFIAALTTSMLSSVNLGIGRIREHTIFSFCRIATIAVGCFLFIRPLGLAGAGLALLLSNVVDIFYFVISLREFLRMSVIGLLRTAYLKPLLLALLLAIPAVAIRPLAASWLGLMFCVSSYLLLYASIAYRIDIFGKTEKQAILGLWGSLRTALSV